MVSDKVLADIYQNCNSELILNKALKQTYPNIKESDLTIRDKRIYLNCITNYFDEDLFATEELSTDNIVQKQGHYIMGFEIITTMMET